MSNFQWNFGITGDAQAAAFLKILTQQNDALGKLTKQKSYEPFKRTADAVAKTETVTRKLKTGIETVTAQYDKQGNLLGKTVTMQEKLHGVMQSTTKVYDAQGNIIKQHSKAIEEAAQKQESFWTRTIRAMGNFNTINKFFRFLVDDLKMLGGAFTGVIDKIVQVGGKMESAQANLKVFSGSEENFDVLRGEADTKAKEFKTTRASVMGSQVELLKAGMSPEEVKDATDAVLTISKAEGIAADYVGSAGANAAAQFAFMKKEGFNAAEAIKTMKSAADSSTTSFEGVNAAMKNAAPVLAGAKVDYKDVATLIAQAAQGGITFGRAGTGIAAAWTRFAKAPKDFKKALEELQIPLKDVQDNLNSPIKLIEIFAAKVNKLPTAEKLSYMNRLFGAAGSAVLNPIVGAGTSSFEEMRTKIAQGMEGGTAQKDIQQQTAIGAWGAMQAAITRVWESLNQLTNVPIAKYFGSIENIIGAIEGRVIALTKRFQEQKLTFKDFGKLNVKDFLKGLPDEVKGEIENVKLIFSNLLDFGKNLFTEFWGFLVNEGILQTVSEAGRKVGETLVASLLSGGAMAQGVNIGISIGGEILKGLLQSPMGFLFAGGIAAKLTFDISKAAFDAITILKAVTGTKAAASLAQPVSQMFGAAGGATGLAAIVGPVVLLVAAAIGGALIGNMLRQVKIGGKSVDEWVGGAIQWGTGDPSKKAKTEEVDSIKEAIDRYNDAINKATDPKVVDNLTKFLKIQQDEIKKLTGEYYHMDEAKVQAAETDTTQRQATSDEQAMIDDEKQAIRQEAKEKADERRRMVEELKAEAPKITGEVSYTDAQGKKQTRTTKENQPPPFKATWVDAKGNIRTVGSKEEFQEQQRKKYGDDVVFQGNTKQAGLSEMEPAEIEQQQKILGAQSQLKEGEKQATEQTFSIATAMSKVTVEINNMGAAFAKWLIEPINVFLERISQAKEKFGDITQGLQEKGVGVGEKFGLITGDKANAARKKLMEEGLARDEQLLNVAQTPEEKQRLKEKMAGRLEKMAEATQGQEQKGFAQKAVDLYGSAEQDAAKAQENEMKRIQIEQDTLRKNISEWEGQLEQGGSAAQRAAVLEQLQGAYQTFGNVEGAARAQSDLKQAKIDEAKEAAETSKASLEALTLQNELTRRMLQELIDIKNGTNTPPPAPESDDASIPTT